MSYFRVGSKDDTIPYYAYGMNPAHAQRAVEQFVGPIPTGRALVEQVDMEEIPEGTEVVAEPAELQATREAYYEDQQ